MTFNTELWNTQTPGAAGGYEIERSLRFNSADSAYLNRTPSTAGNRKTWTWSGWVKRSKSATQGLFGSVNAATQQRFEFISDKLYWVWSQGTAWLNTDAVFRDYSAWYHIVLTSDTDNSIAADRIKIYVNGVRYTLSGNTVSSGEQWDINTTVQHRIGTFNDGGSGNDWFDGYLADIHFIDGQALDPTDFGEFDDNGVWQPIAYAGTYGTNGFFLSFSDNSSASALGTDDSGNGNDWTVNNISVASGAGNDSLRDSPTNGDTANDTGAGGEVPGNYCTINPLNAGSNSSLTDGNLSWTRTSNGYSMGLGTIGVSSGKWYWEYTFNGSTNNAIPVGVVPVGSTATYPGEDSNSVGYNFNGTKVIGTVQTSYGASLAANDVVGVAFDAGAGTVVFYKNGVSQGTATSSLTSGPYCPAVSSWTSGTGSFMNFGQRPFAYSAPSGFKALCTANLDTPTIEDGSTAMDVLTYTGNGTSQTFSGLKFSPDLVWLKKRSDIQDNVVYDITRGVTSELVTNSQNVNFNSQGVTAFNSDGFSVGNGGVSNDSAQTYVAWTWDESASKGFDIVSYTGDGNSGRTVSHSLGVKPDLMIVKRYSSGGSNWSVYHQDLGATQYLQLNKTDTADTASNQWNDTEPTSTVFTVGNGGNVNNNGDDYIAYLFAEIESYSRMGSYTGNGNADGPFVYTGFRPRWLLIKCTDFAGQAWNLFDSARNTYNVVDGKLKPNTDDAETVNTANLVDFLSNGFKLRSTTDPTNGAHNFIYVAFAENPFKTARAR